MMTRALVVLMLASVVAAAPATAQDARLEAARKEGTVVWYTSLALTSAEKVAKLFEAKYPGIKVEVHRTGSQRILQRVMQELRANIKNADVIHTSDAGHYVLLKDKKLLQKYTPAGAERFPPGFKDADGYYFFCGRGDDLLKVNGRFLSPLEVENSLLAHPAVREAAVVGFRDDDGLEKPRAFIVLQNGHSPGDALAESIKAHVREKLAPFKAPRRVTFLDALPKSDRGKVLKAKLRE